MLSVLRAIPQKRVLNSVKLLNSNLPRQTRQVSQACPSEDSACRNGLVLGFYEPDEKDGKPKFSSYAEHFDCKHSGLLSQFITENAKFQGRLGQHKTLNGLDDEFGSICLVGLGQEGVGYCALEALELGLENARFAAGLGARVLRDEGCQTIHVDPMEYPEQAAEGSALAIWRYQENKCRTDRLPIPKLELYESGEIDDWTRGLFKADAQNFARTLCEAPSNQLTPLAFAQTAVDALCPCGVHTEIRNLDWLEQHNFQSMLIVSKSSCEHPVLLELHYCGDSSNQKPVLLLGSGITFNSGGVGLRSPRDLDHSHAAMAGAASVIATVRAAAALSLPINIIGMVPVCENLPSGMALKPGDVIQTLNDRHVGIHSTELVHQLLLADPTVYGQGAFQPRLVIDVGTFSQGVKRAIGGAATPIFTNSNYIWQQIRKAGALTGDRVWLLPSLEHFSRNVSGFSSTDLSNRGQGAGEACLGAAFMKAFVPCLDWLHMDISGTGKKKNCWGVPYLETSRMTGRPVRTLIQFLHQIACPEEAKRELK